MNLFSCLLKFNWFILEPNGLIGILFGMAIKELRDHNGIWKKNLLYWWIASFMQTEPFIFASLSMFMTSNLNVWEIETSFGRQGTGSEKWFQSSFTSVWQIIDLFVESMFNPPNKEDEWSYFLIICGQSFLEYFVGNILLLFHRCSAGYILLFISYFNDCYEEMRPVENPGTIFCLGFSKLLNSLNVAWVLKSEIRIDDHATHGRCLNICILFYGMKHLKSFSYISLYGFSNFYVDE